MKPILTRGKAHDETCYLCPGIARSKGTKNPDYQGAFVFDNDFPSLRPISLDDSNPDISDKPASGICRVVCFSPLHNVTLGEMSAPELEGVLRAFSLQFEELSKNPSIEYILMFENKGKEIGVSNPHPHGQIYATDFVPRLPAAMAKNASDHREKTGKCLFCDILKAESSGSGLVTRNEHFVAYVPSFARFKYEMHIVPIRHVSSIAELTSLEIAALAEIYQNVLARYDNLFEMIIPNITTFYNRPCKPESNDDSWHFHIQFTPPIRSADKLKYLAGFETGGGNIINPSMPENSAMELRKSATVHFSKGVSHV
jgi:UDPglucose--hexose-1-phosphate uridylyltransferase